jgi:hypothetical protein
VAATTVGAVIMAAAGITEMSWDTEHPTPNIQHPTSNLSPCEFHSVFNVSTLSAFRLALRGYARPPQQSCYGGWRGLMFFCSNIGCWAFDVECSMFLFAFLLSPLCSLLCGKKSVSIRVHPWLNSPSKTKRI